MTRARVADGATPAADRLVVRRRIGAPAAWLFEAWTEPRHLMRWWGPAAANCPAAEVDLTRGGRFRIANRFADGSEVWITGRYVQIDPPELLVFTWQIEGRDTAGEQVTVRFEPAGNSTDVTVIHERIADAAARESHASGWDGCLGGLVQYAASMTGVR